jgi:hypothetical protein
MTHAELVPVLTAAARSVLLVLALRAFPVLAAFCVNEATPAVHRSLALVGYTVLAGVAIAWAGFGARDLVVTYALFAVVSVVPYLVAKTTRRRDLLFASAIAVFLLVPSVIASDARVMMLTLGWEFALSAHSFGVSAPRPRAFADYAFFVLVNPALAYSQRGTRIGPPALRARGLLRVLGGSSLMLVSETLPFASLLVVGEDPPGALRGVAGALMLARFYAAHAGLASIQIGLCRQLGLLLPEQYVSPFRASSPRDFWRRWNTWVGTWIATYVFRPFGEYARRRWDLQGRALSGVAVVVTFACLGALHDLCPSLLHREVRHWGLVWFTANGVLLIAWDAVARALARTGRLTFLRAVAPRAAFAVVAIAMVEAVPQSGPPRMTSPATSVGATAPARPPHPT